MFSSKENLISEIVFYNQDLLDLYKKTWFWIKEAYVKKDKDFKEYLYNGRDDIDLFSLGLSSFVLSYSNENYTSCELLDYFYNAQEASGYIPSSINVKTKKFSKEDVLALPILAWAEWTIYIRCGEKKRLKDVADKLDKYYSYLKEKYCTEFGLYRVPSSTLISDGFNRMDATYFTDFNMLMAINEYYLCEIGTIIGDKEIVFKHKKNYFALKSHINSLMWDEEEKFYYDINDAGDRVKNRYIGAFLAMAAHIAGENEASYLIEALKDPTDFGAENAFPFLSMKNPQFVKDGGGWRSAVSSIYTFLVIKGLRDYADKTFVTESVLSHMFYVLESIMPSKTRGETPNDFWDLYISYGNNAGPAVLKDSKGVHYPHQHDLISLGLVMINLMIEDVIGLDICYPQKTVSWTMDKLALMGINNFLLKKNYISLNIIFDKQCREIQLKSEKLYYFKLNILSSGIQKNFPIPAGSCVLLPDKF